jgi:hypothetical protein
MSGAIHFRPVLPALLAVLLAAPLPAFADDESFQELLAKAQAPGDRQAELYAKLARRQVEVANEHFNKGEVAQGHAAIKEIVNFAGKALASAKQARKRLKQTEITLRKTSRRLADVGKTLAFEDRPAVNQAVEEIEGIRDQVLELLFGPTKKSGKGDMSVPGPKPEGQP